MFKMNLSPELLNPETLKNVCRTCLQTQELFRIEDVQSKSFSLRVILSKWIKFEFQPSLRQLLSLFYIFFLDLAERLKLRDKYEQRMPQYICQSCMKRISDVQNFLIRIKNIDIVLKKAISNNKDLPDFEKFRQFKNNPALILTVKNEISEILPTIDDKDSNTLSLDDTFNWEDGASQSNHDESDSKADIKPLASEIPKSKTQENTDLLKPVDAELIYFCGLCETGFNTHEKMVLHKRKLKHFKGGAIYICPYCKKSTKIHAKLKEHLRMHRNEKPNLCATCGKAFTTKGDLSRHVRNVHLKKRSNKCHFCYRLFSKIEHLKEHEKAHANIKYVCSVCGKSFKVHKYWYNHERTHGKNVMRKKYTARKVTCEYQCFHCGKIYVTKQAFEEHVKEHEGLKYECDLCKKVFLSEIKMKKHRNFVHSVARFTCETCGHTVKQKHLLGNHIKSVHMGEKTSYECEYCEKVFFNKSSHKQHLRIHTNDTKYQCKVCLRICTTNRKLMAHLRVHTGERPYECERCGKTFAAKENMSVHMKSHSGPPAHQCTLCSRAFYVNCKLQNHIRQVHNKEDDKKTSEGISDNGTT